jgi:tetratricopeptide (TPR) repeat protein
VHRRLLLASGLLALAVALFSRSILRYPVAPLSAEAKAQFDVSETMNAAVLTALVYPKLIVEIDAVEGYEPSPDAIASLRRILEEHVEPGRSFEVVRDDTIPKSEWDALTDRNDLTSLVEQHVDHLPEIRGDTALVYILYVPRFGGRTLFGMATGWTIQGPHGPLAVDGIVMVQESFREQARLWIGPEKIEDATLIHEFGHVLGLTRNPAHEQTIAPFHCANPQCLMTHPRLRSILYNLPRGIVTGRLPRDYCSDCRADLDTAKRRWRERAAADPVAFRERELACREADVVMYRATLAFLAGRAEEARLALYGLIGADLDPRRRRRLATQLDRVGEAEFAEGIRKQLATEGGNDGAEETLAQKLASRGEYPAILDILTPSYVSFAISDPYRSYGALAVKRRADALWALGRRRESAELCEFAARTASKQGAAFWILAAERWRRLGWPERAHRCLRSLSPGYRKTAGVRLAFLDVRAAMMDKPVSRSELEQLASGPESPRDRQGYELVLARLERAREALESHDARVTRRPDAPKEDCRRAEIAAWGGDEAETFASLERCAASLSAEFWVDPCVSEAFDPLRTDPRFRTLFPHCPPQ